MASLEPFNRVVRLTARAFYDDISMKGDNQPKSSRGDNRGVAVVILDALTKKQWFREEDLAKALKLHSKQLRRILRFFEEEKLITRYHRKESTKGAKGCNAAASAASDDQPVTKERQEKVKIHTHSYCCLDYAQLCDVVRYRIHRMKKKLKDELDSRNTIQHYICPSCNKRYSSFDALQLVSYIDEYFHCESCNGELVAESAKLASEEMGDGIDNVRKCRHEKLKGMLQRVDEQLKPLITQLDRVKNLPAPEFGSLKSLERAILGAFTNCDIGASDSSRNSQGPYGMLIRKTEVEFEIIDGVKEGAESGKNGTELKVLPPWLNLEKKQMGETCILELVETTEDKNDQNQDPKDKSIQEEYVKAYYEALMKKQEVEDAKGIMQEEDEKVVSDSQSERQLGKKYKWQDAEEGTEWEEEQPAAETYKSADFSVDVQESGDGEDGIVWEEG
ncbi:general transcription factor IIE subunit 1 isoform X2 [Setaria italica]|uniref:general transcription factor IIE subunit 1 isoform X2 n=1 Tax=Setaria italica TaxID=4555 RepID=UPI000BE4DCB9|nr:general transcription factor IIE subunit 1 isoform X2 [Setaria italica]XP_034590913.1 general transcription factor IIE subunit 1-like isoform X2 [Setaria viridis]